MAISRLAFLNDDNVIVSIVKDDPIKHPLADIVDGLNVAIGDVKVGEGEYERPASDPILTIQLNKTLVTVGEQLEWTAEVRLSDGSLAPISGRYFVPLLRSDGLQADLIEANLINGEVSGPLSVDIQGVYKMRMDQIVDEFGNPPISSLGKSPVLIVKKQ